MKMEPAEAFVDLSKPSFRGMSYLLNHPEKWPYGYQFSYADIWRCAIGLGSLVWGLASHEVEIALHAENKEAMAVFVDAGRNRGLAHEDVTPAMVAEDIDEWLGRAKT